MAKKVRRRVVSDKTVAGEPKGLAEDPADTEDLPDDVADDDEEPDDDEGEPEHEWEEVEDEDDEDDDDTDLRDIKEMEKVAASPFRVENFVTMFQNPYVAAVAILCLMLGGCYGKKNPYLDSHVQEVGSTSGKDSTTIELKTASGEYRFELPTSEFRGNILTIEEYEAVCRQEEAVASKARAEALSGLADVLKVQTEIANTQAATAAEQARGDALRHILEHREKTMPVVNASN